MRIFERYFSKNPVFSLPDFPETVSLVVVIPIFDDPDIFRTIDSLAACVFPPGGVGVLMVVNHAENCAPEVKARNMRLFPEIQEHTARFTGAEIHFRTVCAFDLPLKQSGVGCARKLAMDKAARYFYEKRGGEGILASLDADTCVEKNYFTELRRCFGAKDVAGVTVDYEHTWENTGNPEEIEAICKYELYLRYYRRCLEYVGHPYAFSCLGSAFAVNVRDYVALGGMNKRQAGEDFYFIQKLISTGRLTHLSTTKVYPSARISERTPFGTGQAVKQILREKGSWKTYHFGAFRLLKPFFDSLEELYGAEDPKIESFIHKQPEGLRNFLWDHGMGAVIREVNDNCASLYQFRKRFFDHFNAFRVLKYLNYVHPVYFEKQDIEEAACCLLNEIGVEGKERRNARELLKVFRRKGI